MTQTENVGFIKAETEQANEHGEKQGDVRDECCDHIEFRAVDIGYRTACRPRNPRSMDPRDTLDHEPNIGHPYASCDHCHALLHAEHNQERGGSNGQVPKELKMER